MVVRRSLPRLARLIVAGAVVLSACGGRFVAPAAVVDGSPISTDTLKQEFDLLGFDPQLRQRLSEPQGEARRKDLTRQLLAFLIELRLIEGYARANDISVQPADIGQALQQTIQSVGGQAPFRRELRSRGLTLAAIRRNIERQLLFGKVEDALGARAGLPSSAPREQKDQVFQRWYTDRLRSAHVEVNPRFGRLNPSTGRITPITSTGS